MPARKKRDTENESTPEGPNAKTARQQLGRRLRELRIAANLTQEDAALHIERVPSTMYRIEDGRPVSVSAPSAMSAASAICTG